MRLFDWFVVVAYIGWIVVDGLRRSKGTDKVDGYFLASRSLPWWAVGLSVMATQMSAVTIVGTTGQAYSTGLRFIQFYFDNRRGKKYIVTCTANAELGDSLDSVFDASVRTFNFPND